MALSKSALKRAIDSVPEGHDVGVWVVRVCRAVEAEVRKQDEALIRRLESKEDIIAMARDANPEHDLTAMLPFLSRFAALVAAREREKCATECESLSRRSRWVRAAINGAPMETCQYAAAIRARGKP